MKNFKETQREKVLRLLREAGNSGINSHDLTYIHSIKQAPTRIYELQEEGYLISTRPLKNRSVIYILEYVPEEKRKRVILGYEGNKAIIGYV